MHTTTKGIPRFHPWLLGIPIGHLKQLINQSHQWLTLIGRAQIIKLRPQTSRAMAN